MTSYQNVKYFNSPCHQKSVTLQNPKSQHCDCDAVSLKYIVMPSKKKTSRGRARKGRNNRKKKNEGEQQQGPLELDTQMERLKIGDESEASFLDEAIKLAAAEKEALESRAVEEEKSFTIDTRQSHTIQCYH